MRIADHVAAELRSHGSEWVMWGDGVLVDVASTH